MSETLSVIVERDLSFAPEKIWRALTQPHLIGEWLMQTDFQPVQDHRFRFTADWGGVDCQVKAITPGRALSYSWEAMGVETLVTWTLTPKGDGTHLRMEQAGFKPDQPQAFNGAKFGWQKFFGQLEQLLEKAP